MSCGVYVVLCPPGTYLNGTGCPSCEEGTYNDKDGQVACTSCPDSKTSPAGSDSAAQCTGTLASILEY